MKTRPLLLALPVIALLSTCVLACSASPDTTGNDENVGKSQEALCRTGICEPLPDPTRKVAPPPPPVQGSSFTCSGFFGYDSQGHAEYLAVVDGQCKVVVPACDPPPPGAICYGYSVLSSYSCPAAYPVEHCNTYAYCTCWSY